MKKIILMMIGLLACQWITAQATPVIFVGDNSVCFYYDSNTPGNINGPRGEITLILPQPSQGMDKAAASITYTELEKPGLLGSFSGQGRCSYKNNGKETACNIGAESVLHTETFQQFVTVSTDVHIKFDTVTHKGNFTMDGVMTSPVKLHPVSCWFKGKRQHSKA